MLLEHDIKVRVRYQETDAQGRLHHANFFTYFEMGRTELLRASGMNYRDMESAGLMLVVAEITCKYRRPALYDDLLTIRTRVTHARGAKIVNEYQVLRGAELLAEGRSVLACIGRDGQLMRLPDSMAIEPTR